MTNSINTVVRNHSALILKAAARLKEGKPVRYESVIPLRFDLEALFNERPEFAISLLGLVLKNEERRGTKVDGINWSGFGFGYNKEHRQVAADLKTRFGSRRPAEFVSELNEEQRLAVVAIAKRYVKQGILSLILTSKG